jgi:hypothetical protein
MSTNEASAASYYLHPASTVGGRPLILIPYKQMEELVSAIGSHFKIDVSVPNFPFTLTFYDDGTPQPVFIGQSLCRDSAVKLQTCVPPAPPGYGQCPEGATVEVKQYFEDFKAKCNAAMMNSKGKGKGSRGGGVGKSKREADPLLNIKDWFSQLRRGQRYLGLRDKKAKPELPSADMSWEEQEQFCQDQLMQNHTVLEPLNVNKVAPFAFNHDPVIIAIDVEAYERAHNLVTEIGISTLDTLDLVGIPPGPNGINWRNHIRSRHIRIKGREGMVNREFCVGHPNAFQFGRSEFIEYSDAAKALDECFEWPFSVSYKHASLKDDWEVEQKTLAKENGFGGVSSGTTNLEQEAASRVAVASVLNGIGNKEAIDHAVNLTKVNHGDVDVLQRGPRERNIIVIGHDLGQDLDYLRTLGSKIFSASRTTYPLPAMESNKALTSIKDTMDTAPLYRVIKGETQPRSLSSVMSDLGLLCYFPHNGGNDARYTLEAWVTMLINARLEGDMDQNKEDKKTEKIEQETKAANAAWNNKAEWAAQGKPLNTPSQTQPDNPTKDEWHVWGKPLEDPATSNAPAFDGGNDDLDEYEAAMMAESPVRSPPRAKDANIAVVAEKMKLDGNDSDEDPY